MAVQQLQPLGPQHQQGVGGVIAVFVNRLTKQVQVMANEDGSEKQRRPGQHDQRASRHGGSPGPGQPETRGPRASSGKDSMEGAGRSAGPLRSPRTINSASVRRLRAEM